MLLKFTLINKIGIYLINFRVWMLDAKPNINLIDIIPWKNKDILGVRTIIKKALNVNIGQACQEMHVLYNNNLVKAHAELVEVFNWKVTEMDCPTPNSLLQKSENFAFLFIISLRLIT